MQTTPRPNRPHGAAEPPGTMRMLRLGAESLHGLRVLVVERQAGRLIDDVAEPEAEQDALLDPGVDAPAGGRRRVRLRRSDRALFKRRFQLVERRARRCAIRRRRRRPRAPRWWTADSIISSYRHGLNLQLLQERAHLLLRGRPTATPSAAGESLLRTIPSAAIANLTSRDSDSIKVPGIEQRRVMVHQAHAGEYAARRLNTVLRHRRRDHIGAPPRSTSGRRSPSTAASAHRRPEQHQEVRRHGAADLHHLRDVA